MTTLSGILTAMFTAGGMYVLLAVGLVVLGVFTVFDRFITPGIVLKTHLFSHDNHKAGLEFGGFMLLALWLAHVVVDGPTMAGHSMWFDLAVSAGVITAFLASYALLRRLLSGAVAQFNGGHDLNHEIYEQGNWAAVCVSLALMTCIVNGITEEEFFGPTPWRDLALAFAVLAVSLASFAVYGFTFLSGRSFMQQMFEKDNAATGVSLLGYVLSVNIIASNVVTMVRTHMADASTLDAVGSTLVLTGVLVACLTLFRWMVSAGIAKWAGVSINGEICDDANVGAGFIDAGVTVGLTFVMIGALVL